MLKVTYMESTIMHSSVSHKEQFIAIYIVLGVAFIIPVEDLIKEAMVLNDNPIA